MTQTHSHPDHAHDAAHSHGHARGHRHEALPRVVVPAGSWLLRSAAWRLGVAGLACAVVWGVVAWAMTMPG